MSSTTTPTPVLPPENLNLPVAGDLPVGTAGRAVHPDRVPQNPNTSSPGSASTDSEKENRCHQDDVAGGVGKVGTPQTNHNETFGSPTGSVLFSSDSSGFLTQTDSPSERSPVVVESRRSLMKDEENDTSVVEDIVRSTETISSLRRPEEEDESTPSNRKEESENDKDPEGNGVSPRPSQKKESRKELSLVERRAVNEKRNKDLLASLGLTFGLSGNSKGDGNGSADNGESDCDSDSDLSEDDNGQLSDSRRGMLLNMTSNPSEFDTEGVAATDSHADDMSKVQTIFPHRESQIRKLYGLLSTSAGQCLPASMDFPFEPHVPPPMFITGPSGTGKTAVTQAVIEAVKQMGTEPESTVKRMTAVSAYVNCATLDVPSIDEFFRSAFSQFKSDVETYTNSTNGKSRKGRKRKPQQLPEEGGMQKKPAVKDRQRESNSIRDSNTAPINHEGEVRIDEGLKDCVGRRSLRPRRSINDDATKEKSESTTFSTTTKITSQQLEMTSTSQMAAWNFGRDLSALLEDRYSGFLVLDHAERLFSLLARKTVPGENSFLSQLLLLPRTIGLNLTVIVITNSTLLEHSRLNSNATTRTSLGTISGSIHPIRIHFGAYRGKHVVKTILRTRRVKRLIVGEGSNVSDETSFMHVVFESFLDTLVQTLHDSTTDLQVIIRYGRFLWPKYIGPLHKDTIEKTCNAVRKSRAHVGRGESTSSRTSMQRGILALLDSKIMPQLRFSLENGLSVLAYDFHGATTWQSNSSQEQVPSHELPSLAKYLLLSAYICQVNRPDRDKQLFSIQGNGRRRKNARKSDQGEELAFGSASQNHQPKALRTRTFPLERMLSVYVCIVGLNQSSGDTLSGRTVEEETLRCHGTSDVYETLSHLRDMGVLHEQPQRSSSEPIRIIEPRYWCSLTREEAGAIAKSVNFRLETYIV